MTESLLLILFMVIIGAAIGGVTNSLAIKMLFRPYKAYYIGKWKVPFTPGLIPKRRSELAEQLGKMVVEHLLTPESLQNKLLNADFKKDLSRWLEEETEPIFQSEKSVEEWMKIFHLPISSERINSVMDDWIETKALEWKNHYSSYSIGEALSEKWQEKIETKIPVLVDWIANKAEQYFDSPEGKAKVKTMIDDFLKGRGTLGNMIGMFLGNTSVADKVQPEIIKFIKHEGTQEILYNLLTKEWEKLKNKKLEEVLEKLPEREIILSLQNAVKNTVKVEEQLSKPLNQWVAPYKKQFLENVLPSWVDLGINLLSSKVANLMEKLHLQQIVQEQVNSFSTERLEQLVLGISRREFKMITYLGALLGGIIGLIQGGIVQLLS
jgi:uncharacterized membrane protein YheB (UPF0754 family)